MSKLKAGRILASVLCGAALTVSAWADSESPLALSDAAAVDQLVDSFIESGSLPLLYVRLEDRDGRVFYEHGARNTDLVAQDVDGDSWIRIWSMSKIVTISTVLDLVEEGVLSLDDPITKYIPEFASLVVATGAGGEDLSLPDDAVKAAACPSATVPMSKPPTVRDLINHQDGFFYAWQGISCLDTAFKDQDFATAEDSDELIARLSTLPLINQPGDREVYGFGTTVLGVVAERATGKSLKQLVEERVTGPLGIEGLRYGQLPGTTLPPHISGADGTLRPASSGELDIFGRNLPDYSAESTLYLGGEGMIATADGYADFARMLLRRGELNGYRLLNPETIDEMIAPHTELNNGWGHNGYNLWIGNGRLSDGSQGPGPLWIGGGYEGTHYWIDPERGFVGVIMSQIHQPPAGAANRDERIRMAIYDQLGWEAPAEAAQKAAESP